MKKLMLAAIVTVVSTSLFAATANWKMTASNIYNGTGSTETSARYTGTAYVFDSAKMSQSALFDIITAGTFTTSAKGYAGSGTINNGTPASLKFSYGELSASSDSPNNYSFYFVIIDGDKSYFSTLKSVDAGVTATDKTVAFGSQNLASLNTYSSLAPTATGYAGEGKWSSVPEPTSGLLMLLGFAGLALRRKQK